MIHGVDQNTETVWHCFRANGNTLSKKSAFSLVHFFSTILSLFTLTLKIHLICCVKQQIFVYKFMQNNP